MKKTILAGLLIAVLCLATGLGCGGGSGGGPQGATKSPGSLQFDILWPTRSRVIPAASQSLVIQVTSGTQAPIKKVIPRPPAGTNTSSVRFDSLTPGITTVEVDAFPNPDGTGTIQATGGVTVAIVSGVITQTTIDPTSTVAVLDLVPSLLVTIPARTTQMIVSPKNAVDALVLVAPSSLMWSSSAPTTATVDSSGLVTAIALGTSTVRVVDTESGQTASSDVNVVQPVVVNPPAASTTIGDQVQFTATVTQLTSQSVTWKIEEKGNVGSVNANGLYTPPQVAGTFHVTATSVSDPMFSSTATVTVTTGSGTVIIQ